MSSPARSQFNLAIMCPDQKDATSLYRAAGPLSVLRRDVPDVRMLYLPNSIDWSVLGMVDAILMQRPFRPADVAISKMAYRMGIPIWVDLDDDLFRVPAWNPTSPTYNNPAIQRNVADCLAHAAVVTVSTRHLADNLHGANDRIVVIPNAWNDVFFPRKLKERDNTPGQFLVLWRGSATHRMDLRLAADACIDLAKSHPNVTWLFVGDTPWFVDYMPDNNVKVAPALDPFEYHDLVAKLRPNVWIVPLCHCDFNRSKSNCSWIEGSWAGAATLAPAWPEWAHPGITHYRDEKDFAVKLRIMLQTSPRELDAQAEKSWQYVSEHLRLTRVNERRVAILEGLRDARR